MFIHFTFSEKHFKDRIVYCIVKLQALVRGQGAFEWGVGCGRLMMKEITWAPEITRVYSELLISA